MPGHCTRQHHGNNVSNGWCVNCTIHLLALSLFLSALCSLSFLSLSLPLTYWTTQIPMHLLFRISIPNFLFIARSCESVFVWFFSPGRIASVASAVIVHSALSIAQNAFGTLLVFGAIRPNTFIWNGFSFVWSLACSTNKNHRLKWLILCTPRHVANVCALSSPANNIDLWTFRMRAKNSYSYFDMLFIFTSFAKQLRTPIDFIVCAIHVSFGCIHSVRLLFNGLMACISDCVFVWFSKHLWNIRVQTPINEVETQFVNQTNSLNFNHLEFATYDIGRRGIIILWQYRARDQSIRTDSVCWMARRAHLTQVITTFWRDPFVQLKLRCVFILVFDCSLMHRIVYRQYKSRKLKNIGKNSSILLEMKWKQLNSLEWCSFAVDASIVTHMYNLRTYTTWRRYHRRTDTLFTATQSSATAFESVRNHTGSLISN